MSSTSILDSRGAVGVRQTPTFEVFHEVRTNSGIEELWCRIPDAAAADFVVGAPTSIRILPQSNGQEFRDRVLLVLVEPRGQANS